MKSLKKGLALALMALGLVGAVGPFAYAASPFIVTVSSVVPNGAGNGASQFTGAGYPNYTGNLSVRHIGIAYTTTSSGAQTEYVELWNTCTSSTTATLKWRGIVQSTATGSGQPGPYLDIALEPRLMNLTSPCFTRSANDITNGTIKATLWYE